MNKLFIVLSVLAFASSAKAAQFLAFPESGQYTIRCQAAETAGGGTLDPTTGTSEISFERVDAGNEVELARLQVDPSTGMAVAVVTVAVTPGNDAEVACFALDRSGNRSERSVDSAVADFTAPGAPVMSQP